ncbi:MAG: DUF3619 family protein [Gallionella sp.]
MTPQLNPQKISQLLTHSTLQLGGNTLAALRSARDNALHHQKVSLHAIHLSNGHLLAFSALQHKQKWLLAILLAMTFASLAWGWQHQHEQQISALDIAILSDELPIDVFIDEH